MFDPVTALGAATAAFKTIKAGIQVGRDIESMGKDLGRWMGAINDLKKLDQYAKNPPFYKKVFAANSVEEEAMQIFMAKKKAEDMRDQLREIISVTRGPSAWQELLKLEADIRKQRQEEIYNRQEKIESIKEWTLGIFLVILVLGILIGITWLVIQAQ